MKEICGKNIKSVVYQFDKPLTAIEIYNSIEEFNTVYEKVLEIVNLKAIKSLQKEFIKEQKELKKKDKIQFEELMNGFVGMRLNAIIDREINCNTKYINIMLDNKLRIFAAQKTDPRYSDYAWVLKAKVILKDDPNKSLKRRLAIALGKNLRGMLS